MRGAKCGGGKGQSGAVIATTAICLMMFLGLLGLVLDLGHLYLVRSELQRAADASALAGARALFLPPLSAPPQCSQAQTRALEMAQANLVGGLAPAVLTPASYTVPWPPWAGWGV